MEFKLTVLVYKVLNNVATPYLPDDCQLIATTGAISLNHQTISSAMLSALLHVLEIEPSPLTDHALAIVFPHTSIGLICPWIPFIGNPKHI